jgi:hypothetical protein
MDQNRPSGVKRLPKSIPGAHFLGFRHQLARPKATRGAPRSFSMDFAWILTSFFMILDPSRHMFHDFGKVSPSSFVLISQVAKNRQEPPRTSKEPGTQRTSQNMILQIAIRTTPSTANNRISRNGTYPNWGAAVSRRMAYSIT